MYHYQEYNPDIRLSTWIKKFWLATDFTPSGIFAKVLPDACANIIFDVDASGFSSTKIFGTTTDFIEVNPVKHVRMFGIRFKPAGIAAFTRIPQMEFTDREVDLALVETLFDDSFYEALPEKQSAEEIIAHTNNYLINLLPRLYLPDTQVLRAIDTINLAKGQLNLSYLADNICLSQRHFERKFKNAVGVSPKMFAKTVRFQHAIHDIVMQPDKDLLTIAIECGYYDRTHLMRDVKSLSGDIPTDIRKKKQIYYSTDEAYVY